MNSYEQINQRISNKLHTPPGMKLSVVWRQYVSAVEDEIPEISKWNAALAKSFVEMKKREVVKFFNATIDGKYIKFSDGSQARY